ncbi:hypothetical protein [Streptobacillus moniliformis]|uniref:hypothetical protein n=1 Tax=Streptobacillus moniliformis TaxID=34105 RepID=UPI000A6A60A5|nr:hypothetical protein [Streptobacillus moniliformis]
MITYINWAYSIIIIFLILLINNYRHKLEQANKKWKQSKDFSEQIIHDNTNLKKKIMN